MIICEYTLSWYDEHNNLSRKYFPCRLNIFFGLEWYSKDITIVCNINSR